MKHCSSHMPPYYFIKNHHTLIFFKIVLSSALGESVTRKTMFSRDTATPAHSPVTGLGIVFFMRYWAWTCKVELLLDIIWCFIMPTRFMKCVTSIRIAHLSYFSTVCSDKCIHTLPVRHSRDVTGQDSAPDSWSQMLPHSHHKWFLLKLLLIPAS